MKEHAGLRHLPLPLLVYVFTDCIKIGKKRNDQAVQVLRWCAFCKEIKLFTILYEGLMFCSLLDPTETMITGDTELKPATEVGSRRF